MATTAKFCVLGAVEACVDGQRVDLGYPRQQCVLVALLIEANRSVSADQLLGHVWGDGLPLRGRETLYSYLSRLRRVLEPASDVRIARRSGGYVLDVDPMAVDLHRFHHLVGQARSAEDDDQALSLMGEALDLWRGEAFANLDTPWINEVRGALAQQRLAVEMERTDLLLRRGQHGELVAELEARVATYPLDEQLVGQLMRAFYLAGRPSDALEHYRRFRTRLAEDLGTDPGTRLQQLHQRILSADPTLIPPSVGASTRTPTPRQLPAAPRLFTGRDDELARLTTTVETVGGRGGVMVISAIGGSGGIGKTWFAVCWAHRNLHRFPDGQLYVNLNGFDPTGEPLSSAVAVRGFLEALGVAPAAIPVNPQAGTGLYRSLVAGRRMLIVLDNARDTAQVTPLLPGDAGCMVLVTSRNRLDGLVTAHGAKSLALNVLTDEEARRLLIRHLGQERVAAEPAAATELLQRCAGLPLAIGIIAARAAATPTLSLASLVNELRDQVTRLDTISTGTGTGELASNLRQVFTGSYNALGSDTARLFRLLGLAQLPDVGVAAASLVGMPATRVYGQLRELEAAHLLQQYAPGRYRMHDLVRLYAHERAQHEEHDHDDVLRRLVDFYLHTSHIADKLLYPHRLPITLDPPVAGGEPEQLTNAAATRAWFETEHACLTIVEQHAAQHDWDSALWQLVWTANTFRLRRGYQHHNLKAWLAGVAAADRINSPALQANARHQLAQTLTDLDRLEEARDHLTRGLALAKVAGHVRVEVRIHTGLAQTLALQGNNQEALGHATEALELCRTLDAPKDMAFVLSNLGWVQARLGEYSDARASCQTALGLNRALSERDSEAETLDSLGYIAHHTGELHDALTHYHDALALARETGNANLEATILEHFGETHIALHQLPEARRAWQRATELFHAQHRLTETERVRSRLLDLLE